MNSTDSFPFLPVRKLDAGPTLLLSSFMNTASCLRVKFGKEELLKSEVNAWEMPWDDVIQGGVKLMGCLKAFDYSCFILQTFGGL